MCLRASRLSRVVAVRRPNGKVTYYYTPVAEWLEEAWGARGEDG